MSTEDEMWRDYDHYINTGELSEYFEYEPYCYDEDIENPYTTQPEEYDYIDHLDDVIRNLKNLKKENERIIKEQKKKESAQKKKASAQKKTTKSTHLSPTVQQSQPKQKNDKDVPTAVKLYVVIICVIFFIFILVYL